MKFPKDNQLETSESKILFKILKRATKIHNGIDTMTEHQAEWLVVDIIPSINQAMRELGLEICQSDQSKD